jgi:hypothetical protein
VGGGQANGVSSSTRLWVPGFRDGERSNTSNGLLARGTWLWQVRSRGRDASDLEGEKADLRTGRAVW